MKRLDFVLELVDACFDDIEAMGLYSKVSDLNRDKTRFKHELKNRGLNFVTIDLPPLAKHLERCLADGAYTQPTKGILAKSRKREQVPVFLRALFLGIFRADGEIKPNPDINCILALRQLYKGFSKEKTLCERTFIDEEVSNFLTIEEELPLPTLNWSRPQSDDFVSRNSRISLNDFLNLEGNTRNDLFSKGPIVDSRSTTVARAVDYVQRFADLAFSELAYFDLDTILDKHTNGNSVALSHGTGSVANHKRDHNKYDFPAWSDRLDVVFPYEEVGVLNYSYCKDISSNEEPSKLIAVPKTMSGPRLIASEPSSNMWCQQIIRRWLNTRIEATCFGSAITLQDQSRNQIAAQVGSIDGSKATIDLSSASDRLSLYLLERIARNNPRFLQALASCRSQVISNAINENEWKSIHLRKAFSQGNACTFPVQSLVYAVIAAGAVAYSREYPLVPDAVKRAMGAVVVYGDDIITPDDAFETTVDLLTTFKLVVNQSKTFHVGKFRESCGADYYDGCNITPTYVRTLDGLEEPESIQSLLDCANNAYLAGWWRLSAKIVSKIENLRFPILPYDSGGVGHLTFSCVSKRHLRARWSYDLQQQELLTDSFSSKSKMIKQSADSYFSVFQYSTEKPQPTTKWKAGVQTSKRDFVKKSRWIAG